MTDLERLTAAFHAMNPWARGMLVELAMGYAEDFPAAKAAPAVDALLAAEGVRSGVDYEKLTTWSAN
jgi:hypothetical protein